MLRALQSQFAGSDPDVFTHIGALDGIEFDRYKEMKKQWLQHAKLTWLVQGTILQEEVLDIFSSVKFAPPESPIVLKKSQLESYECPELDPDLVAPSPNHATLLYHRLCDFNYADSAILTVLITLIQEKAFAQLRTKEQLGYVVSLSLVSQQRTLGSQFLI